MHLLLPLLASLLFVVGLIFVKQVSRAGISPWTITFVSNQWAAILFSILWLFGGSGQPWSLLWQPAVVACLYILGLTFTFSAVENGDVSLATPIFGVKVVLVAVLLTFVASQQLSANLWYAACLASLGIGLIQWTGAAHHHRVAMTVSLAIAAAVSFATFDVLVQRWAPAWGAGRFLPIVYWMAAVLSLGFLPHVQWHAITDRKLRPAVLAGTILIALQAICIVLTLSVFGDATRVNVVYALRGLWGVLFAWAAAHWWGGSEAELPRQTMLLRLGGAGLLTAAVILAISGRG